MHRWISSLIKSLYGKSLISLPKYICRLFVQWVFTVAAIWMQTPTRHDSCEPPRDKSRAARPSSSYINITSEMQTLDNYLDAICQVADL